MIHVIGASGKCGRGVCGALLEAGIPFLPVVRSAARWVETGLPGSPKLACIEDREALCAALADAKVVVSCAGADKISDILAAAPKDCRFVFLGSTRRFTRWPDDPSAQRVIAGEQAFLAAGRPGFLLHSTMIYGTFGENNVQRLAALLRRLPLVPLPGGGRALVQPIHQSDVIKAVLAASHAQVGTPEVLTIAGPTAVSYADFVRAVAHAAGLAAPHIVPVPVAVLLALAPLTRLPFLPRVEAMEIRRLIEDKAFDISPVRLRLGLDPVSLEDGLALTFAPKAPGGQVMPAA